MNTSDDLVSVLFDQEVLTCLNEIFSLIGLDFTQISILQFEISSITFINQMIEKDFVFIDKYRTEMSHSRD